MPTPVQTFDSVDGQRDLEPLLQVGVGVPAQPGKFPGEEPRHLDRDLGHGAQVEAWLGNRPEVV